MEQGADFWTVSIPQSVWPRSEGFRTKIKIKQYETINPNNMKDDPQSTLLGPSAYTIYPITYKQERPFPGPASDNPTMYRLAEDGLDGY
jgi:hypothetical protein